MDWLTLQESQHWIMQAWFLVVSALKHPKLSKTVKNASQANFCFH